MKKILLIFMLVGTTSYAQTFAPTGAKWTYTQTHAFSSVIDTLIIRSIGDTVLLGRSCKILEKSEQSCDLREKREYMYSDSGKVFYFDSALHSFQVLYNFNDTIGDSTIMFKSNFSSIDTITYIVDSVSSIIINGHLLKELFVHYIHIQFGIWSPVGSGKIIERIGETGYMFPWVFGACDANFGSGLRCYEDTVIGFYDFKIAPSCNYITTRITDILSEQETTIVYPNPLTTSSILQLNTQVKNAEVVIYNILGKEMVRKKLTGDRMEIERGSFESGVYFVRVRSGERQWVEKIVVE